MNPADPEDRTVASAEFVLGTLTGAEREQFLAQLAQDRELQAEVGYWQDRLLGLTRMVSPVEPSQTVWQKIDASLRSDPRGAQATAAQEPSRLASRSRSPTPTLSPTSTPSSSKTPTSTPSRFWERVGFWRGFSGVALAASLLLALLLVMRPPVTPDVTYLAVLQSPDMRAGWVVQAAERGPVKLLPLVDHGQIPEGKSWQFWTKGKNASAPTSLGLLPQAGGLEVPRDRLTDLGEEQLFEITLEPQAGSPTGRPTGPVLFIGKAQRV